MRLLRDLARLKPSAMVVLGEVIEPETIESIYVSLRECEEAYIGALLETTERYAKFRFEDILKRIEWAFTDPSQARRTEYARDAIIWFNLMKPLDQTSITHWIDMPRLRAFTNYDDDVQLNVELSMFVLLKPLQSTYDAITDPSKKAAYLDWAVFMAMTGDQLEIASYATRQYSLAA